jgi:hypothetical protein
LWAKETNKFDGIDTRIPKKSWAIFCAGDVRRVLDSFHFFQRINPMAKTWKKI